MIKATWEKFSLNGQMGNIGSEISRAFSLKEKGDLENMEKSVFRALELIDLTINDTRLKGKTLEIFKLREIICDLFLGKNTFSINQEIFKNYFFYFALNANK
jgi:hypothetical protein